MVPENERRLAKALQSVECNLPCYLGIIPGETTLQEAKTNLEDLGGEYIGHFQRSKTDGAFDDTYEFHIGDPSTGKKIVFGSISLISDNHVVQVIENAGAGTALPDLEPNSSMVYHQFWRRYYSAWQIFQQLGEPNQIYTFHDRSDTLILFFDNPDIRIEIIGTEQENNLCPRSRSVHYLSVNMTISNMDSPFDIDGAGGVPLTDRQVYSPIEETFGVTAHEFYVQVTDDPSVCIKPTTSN